MTGPVLAELIETMVGALNARDIPTAGSILEHFNRELVHKVCLQPDTRPHTDVREFHMLSITAQGVTRTMLWGSTGMS